MTLGDLTALVKALPPLGEEAETFKKDIVNIIEHQPLMPEKSKGA